MTDVEFSNRLCFKTATALLEGYRAQQFTPVEVVKDILKRIGEVNAIYNVMNYTHKEEELMKQAEASAKRWKEGKPEGLLDGVPATIKDLLFVPGMPTTEGSKLTPFPPDYHFVSPTVQALLKHNVIIIGKVSTSEYGWRASGISPLGITRNAFDHTKATGGSSCGSAVSVQLGFSPISIGSDAGGSIRIPGTHAGLTALKPSCGLVPHAPVSVFGPLAVVGPLARDARDLCLVLDVISYENPEDPQSILPFRRKESWTTIINSSTTETKTVKEMTIGVSFDLGGYVKHVDPQIKTSFSKVIEVFRSLGATIEYIDQSPEWPTKTHDTYSIMKTLWSSTIFYLIHYISESQNHSLPHLRATLEPELIDLADRSEKAFSALDVNKAHHKMSTFGRDLNKFHNKYDLILTPSMVVPPHDAEKEVPDNVREIATGVESTAFEEVDYKRFWCWTPFSYVFNMSRQPCVVLPCGQFEGEKGCSIGFQVVGKVHDDATVLRACVEYQDATQFHKRIANEKV